MFTSLSFMANMIALACSAAFPTIGSKITLINAIGIFHVTDAPYETKIQLNYTNKKRGSDTMKEIVINGCYPNGIDQIF